MENRSDCHTATLSSTFGRRVKSCEALAQAGIRKPLIEVDGRTVNLSPGMAVTVEIKTGKRRVVEYFLGPAIPG
jgi:multidrug efflux pump subunit AcrA (membrane-fusion protein)